MPYIFGLLVVANAGLFGYMLLAPKSEPTSVKNAKAQLSAPVVFSNISDQLPPEIGKK